MLDPLSSGPGPRLEGREALVRMLQSVAEGDRTALGQLYRATSAKLYGVCLRILKDGSESEDVLQDVYLVVWRRAEAFDATRGSPITWLAAIARNRAIDRLRARRPEAGADAVDTLADAVDPAMPADAALERTEAYRRLEACLSALEPKHASAIRRAFLDGDTYDMLAGRAGVPLGTMKSWVRRSLIRLRGCLES